MGGYKKKGGKGGGRINPHHKKKNLSKIQKVAAKWSKAEIKAAKSAIKDMHTDESEDDEEVKMKGGDGDSHGMRQKSKKGQK